jgi:hypothetical protein
MAPTRRRTEPSLGIEAVLIDTGLSSEHVNGSRFQGSDGKLQIVYLHTQVSDAVVDARDKGCIDSRLTIPRAMVVTEVRHSHTPTLPHTRVPEVARST